MDTTIRNTGFYLVLIALVAGLATGCSSSRQYTNVTDAEEEIPLRDCSVEYDSEDWVTVTASARSQSEFLARKLVRTRGEGLIADKIRSNVGDYLRSERDRINKFIEETGQQERIGDTLRSALTQMAASRVSGVKLLSCDTHREDAYWHFIAEVGMPIGERAENWSESIESHSVLEGTLEDEELREVVRSWLQWTATRGSVQAEESGS